MPLKKSSAAKKNQQPNNNNNNTHEQKVTTGKVIAMCLYESIVRSIDRGSLCETSSSSSLNAENEIVITIILVHIRWKSPSLTICPKLFFEFCGNSVEIHVPTISLITAYRCTHIYTIDICMLCLFYHHARFIIAFMQIHFRPEILCLCIKYIHTYVCTHKYLATYSSVRINRVEWVYLTCSHVGSYWWVQTIAHST